MKLFFWVSTFLLGLILVGCNATKFIPEGEYLLDKVSIVVDTKDLKPSDLKEYVRQTENFAVFGVFKMQLGIYNWAGKDSSKWINRTLKKIGDPPVIYSSSLTSVSVQQLQRVIENKGFMKGKVETNVLTEGKKAAVEYIVKANKPYKLRQYNIDLRNDSLNKYAADTSRSLIRQNMFFDVDLFNAERERIATRFRQRGYYNFNKEFLTYKADSSLNSYQVDVNFKLRDYLIDANDSVNKVVFKRYRINKVVYYTNTDPNLVLDLQTAEKFDTVSFRNFVMITPKERIISLDALVQNTYINPKAYYSDRTVDQTYSALNSLGPIKYANISFKELNDSLLDCNVIIIPNKSISVSAELGGTFTDGFWGVAGTFGTVNRNIFKGAETLSFQGKVALEKQDSLWAQETSIQVGLKFPRFMFPVGTYDFKRNLHATTEFTGAFSHQYRPGEFESQILGGAVKYGWSRRQNKHSLDLFDLSYVYFPSITNEFRDKFLTTGIFNNYNYIDHLIMRLGFSSSTSTFSNARPLKSFSTSRYSVESAGNLLTAMNKLLGYAPSIDGYYNIFSIRYSQYAKAEYATTFHQIFDKDKRMVYRFSAGAAVPYGNGDAIPWEKRFYSGGANSVRGWGESTLGPGVYQRIDSKRRDYNQVGDLKLDMNVEYRAKLFWKIEGALFLDGGNIWTIKPYVTQDGGAFKIDSFLSQIALAYGVGLRWDFSFFIARLDMGIRLSDPARVASERWRVSPNWEDDFAVHVAIGYPF